MQLRFLQQLLVGIVLSLWLIFSSGCLWQSSDAEQRASNSIGYNSGYSPEQPIPYSHELHIGKHNIQYQYYHNQVENSKSSNIPALSTCMNCHQQINGTEHPEYIKKLREAYTNNKPIE